MGLEVYRCPDCIEYLGAIKEKEFVTLTGEKQGDWVEVIYFLNRKIKLGWVNKNGLMN